jgi:hypothetical protein
MYNIDIKLEEDVKIDYYDTILKKYPQWIEFRRDIKLELLLNNNNKKIQYDIEDMNPPIYGVGHSSGTSSINLNELHPTFIIRSMSFIISSNKVEKVVISLSPLTTYYGKIFSNLIKELGIDYFKDKIHQYTKENNIVFFYIKL